MEHLLLAARKLIQALETEGIDYMIVGGFATSFYNRFRMTI